MSGNEYVLSPRNGTDLFPESPLDLQIQIYILSGVFGGVCLILLITVFTQMAQISSLKKGLAELRLSRPLGGTPIARRKAEHPPPDALASAQPKIPIDPDVAKRFSMYSPSIQNDQYAAPAYKYQESNPGFVPDSAQPPRGQGIDPRYLQYRSANPSGPPSQNPGYARSVTSTSYGKY